MLEIFSTLLTGVLSGGATGLIGIVLQRYFDLQNKKQEIEVVKLNHQNSIELAKLESERTQIRADADYEIADRQADSAESLADYEGLKAALAADKATYLDSDSQKKNDWVGKFSRALFTLVDFLRGIVRPAMTLYLCGLVTAMFYWVRELGQTYGVTLTAEQIHELMLQIITTILYVFTTVALFWYGSRPTRNL